jgi:hypothetical protein
MDCMKAKSLLPIWLALIGTSIAGADQASACECLLSTPASIIERVDVAFEGEVIEAVGLDRSCVEDRIAWLKANPERLDQRNAEDLLFSCNRGSQIRVLTPLKGQPGGIVTVYSETPCGYFFKKGERLKVVAWYTRGHRLSTGDCAMTSANRDPSDTVDYYEDMQRRIQRLKQRLGDAHQATSPESGLAPALPGNTDATSAESGTRR